jgi:mono/diheme cytochrome c family protein
MRKTISSIVLLTAAVLLVGCGGTTAEDDDSGGSDTTSLGMELLNERLIGFNAGCITCHALDEDVTLVGPSLFGIGSRAAGQVAGQSAADYLRESIVNPDAFVVPGFTAGQMATAWTDYLTDEQIDSLVEVLLEL